MKQSSPVLIQFCQRVSRGIPAALLLMMLVAAFPAHAESIRVDIILAQDGDGGIDSRLAPLHQKLTQVFNFSSYRLVGSQNVAVEWNRTERISLPGKGRLHLTPITRHGRQVIIQAEVYRGATIVLNTQFRVQPGGTVVVNGPTTSEGTIIIGLSLQ